MAKKGDEREISMSKRRKDKINKGVLVRANTKTCSTRIRVGVRDIGDIGGLRICR